MTPKYTAQIKCLEYGIDEVIPEETKLSDYSNRWTSHF